MAAVKMVTATVAPRKTVYVGAEKKTIWDADSKRDVPQVKASQPKGPGEQIELPEDEIIRLRKLGFLTDPDAEQIAVGNGPTFGTAGGPTVQAAA
jgi:hypothetical protein